MSRVSGGAPVSMDAVNIASSQKPMQASNHDIGLGAPIPMTSFGQSDHMKLSLQQLGHGSPEDFTVTPEQLDEQKANLRPTLTVTTPFSNNLVIQRLHQSSSEQFTDFAAATRAQLTQLASIPSGQELLHSLDYQATPVAVPSHNEPWMPPTEQYVRMPLAHRVNIINPDLSNPALVENTATWNAADAQLQLHLDGSVKYAGLGSNATVTHQPDILQHAADIKHGWVTEDQGLKPVKEVEAGVTFDGAVSLGHELIHAAHSMNGFADFRVREDGLQRAEQYTVGLADGNSRVFSNIPTENMLRQDMNEQYYADATMVGPMPMRNSYGGKPILDSEVQMPKAEN